MMGLPDGPRRGGLAALTGLVLIHGFGEGIINPVHKSIPSQSVHAEVRGGLVTTNAIVQNTAKTITPIALAPVLVTMGPNAYDTLFLLTGAITLLAVVVALVALSVGEVSGTRQRLRDEGRG